MTAHIGEEEVSLNRITAMDGTRPPIRLFTDSIVLWVLAALLRGAGIFGLEE